MSEDDERQPAAGEPDVDAIARAAVARFAGGLAHDFNNLLTAIKTNVELAIEALPGDAPVRAELDDVKRAAERAAAMTRQLLAFSERQLLRVEAIEPREWLRAVEAAVVRVAGPHVTLRMSVEGTRPFRGDRARLEEALLALVANASEAMPGGGVLCVEARPAKLGDAPAVALRVRDEGVGMNEETRARALEALFTTKSTETHTGMGLAAARGTITQLGGRIDVESTPQRGSTFTLVLPASDDAPRSEAVPAQAHPGATVLVVEDEALVRRTVRRILERRGFRVLEAVDGEDALAVCARDDAAIDLVLTDVVMPKMGGRALVDRLSERFPRLRAIFMSGHDEKGVALHGVPSEPMLLLEKPFTSEALVARVEEAISARR